MRSSSGCPSERAPGRRCACPHGGNERDDGRGGSAPKNGLKYRAGSMLQPGRTVRRLGIVVLVTVMAVLALHAQGRRFRFGTPPPDSNPLPYDGRFTIVRLWYPDYPGWSYDYPDMERNLTLILSELTCRPPASRWQQHPPDGRSGADEVSARLPLRAGLLVSDRQRGERVADVSRERRVPDRRRLPLPGRMGRLRGRDEEGAAGRAGSSGSRRRTRSSTRSFRSRPSTSRTRPGSGRAA